MKVQLPGDWLDVLGDELKKPYFQKLSNFVDGEREKHEVFPPEDEVFSAFSLAPYHQVKVLLLGQDPYHDNNQAHGLCFSVKPGISTPPSLANMYKELKSDIGCSIPNNGYLVHWAEQGILMLNAVLTVQAHKPNSHKDQGWETFTDAVIKVVSQKSEPVIFVLWGKYAQKKTRLIDAKRHHIIQGAHPSPLSAKAGFFGSKPFSKINELLRQNSYTPIDWQIPNI